MRNVFIGLGNPTTEYCKHRHNVGMMAIDALHQHLNAPAWQNKNHSHISRTNDGIILAKPQTYMNLSGTAVVSIMQFYKNNISEIIVLHDDLELPLGKIKIKIGGGHGGHNGLRDIDQKIGTDYMRIRIGIGRPEHKTQVHDYVLSPFMPDQVNTVQNMISTIIKLYTPLLKDNLETLQRLLNQS